MGVVFNSIGLVSLVLAREHGASPRELGVMFAIDTMNALAYLYPSVPRINVRFLGDLSLAFTSPEKATSVPMR